MMSKSKVIVVLGPTASGKSGMGVNLAKRFHGEIISADSRQVYRGLNIGTGKIMRREMKGTPHHLLDVANPKKQFSVVEFVEKADKAICEIQKRGHIPIIVGGTGFYIDALLGRIQFSDAPPNLKLRKQLAKKSPKELFAILKTLDKKRAKTIDPYNARRLIRAIEIAKTKPQFPKDNRPAYHPLIIGIKKQSEELKSLIHSRLLKHIKQGMIEEGKQLRKSGLPWKRFLELGLEYRFLAQYLQRKISKRELVRQLESAIWHYARRQQTWFRRHQDIHWIKNEREATGLIKNFLR